jgi:hypothetical protein
MLKVCLINVVFPAPDYALKFSIRKATETPHSWSDLPDGQYTETVGEGFSSPLQQAM